MSHKGTIHQIIGPVIDIKFMPEEMPELLNAIHIKFEDRDIVVEAAQHIGDDVVRCVALSSTDGLKRGMEAIDSGAPISVPVGKAVLGRLFNVVGDTIDDKGPVNEELRLPIHRAAPSFEEQDTSAQIFETGIKVIDLIAPYTRGGKSRTLRGSRRRQNRIDPGTDPQYRQGTRRNLRILRSRRTYERRKRSLR